MPPIEWAVNAVAVKAASIDLAADGEGVGQDG